MSHVIEAIHSNETEYNDLHEMALDLYYTLKSLKDVVNSNLVIEIDVEKLTVYIEDI